MELKPPKAFLHENVWECDQTLVISDETPSFKHYLLKAQPPSVGWKVARTRGYSWNTHRLQSTLRYDIYDVFDFVTAAMDNPQSELSETYLSVICGAFVCGGL